LKNFIPDEKVSEVRHMADIVDVVSDVVMMKKAGRNFVGLCPFHAEKTPSFTVSSEKQIFHCFGCGEGGDVFNFLMKHEGLSFPEAVKNLARRYGVDIPEQAMTPEQKRRITERETLYDVNRQAMDFFRHVLLETAQGKKGWPI